MNTYYTYNTESTQSVSETLTISGGQVQLRHIPREGSVNISGFMETTELVVDAGSYNAVGTPVTAADMNEIKNHMANSTLHGGGTHPITAAQVQQMVAHMANTSIHGGGSSSSGNMNFIGTKWDLPRSSSNGDVLYYYRDNTVYISPGGGTWYPAYSATKTYWKVITAPTDIDVNLDNWSNVNDDYPDWFCYYIGSSN